LEELRGKPVSVAGKVVKPGEHFEVTGLATYQVSSD
jgi:beta-fructofuranosidase